MEHTLTDVEAQLTRLAFAEYNRVVSIAQRERELALAPLSKLYKGEGKQLHFEEKDGVVTLTVPE
jgi:hypothetical protein